MILLPSRARPHKLTRFLEAYHETGATEPGLLMLEERDVDAYSNVKLPDNWQMQVVPQSLAAKKFNDGAMIYAPNEDYYFVIGDDLIPLTREWDKKLRAASNGYFIVYGNDGIHGKNIATHPVVPGELVREVGYLANPLVGHFYFDIMWMDIGVPNKLLMYVDDVLFRHEHFTVTGDYDQACAERGSSENDRIIYDIWRETGYLIDVKKAEMFCKKFEADACHA